MNFRFNQVSVFIEKSGERIPTTFRGKCQMKEGRSHIYTCMYCMCMCMDMDMDKDMYMDMNMQISACMCISI